MSEDFNRAATGDSSSTATPVPRRSIIGATFPNGQLRAVRSLRALMAALLWLTLVYGLPLYTLRESRRIAKGELAHLLQTKQPDTPSILDAFDRSTEQVLFSVSGPYFILGVAMLFLIAHIVSIKRRLYAAERNIQTLRDVVLGVDGVSLR